MAAKPSLQSPAQLGRLPGPANAEASPATDSRTTVLFTDAPARAGGSLLKDASPSLGPRAQGVLPPFLLTHAGQKPQKHQPHPRKPFQAQGGEGLGGFTGPVPGTMYSPPTKASGCPAAWIVRADPESKDRQHTALHIGTHLLPRYGKETAVLSLCPPDSGLETNMQTWGLFLKGKTKASLKAIWAEPREAKPQHTHGLSVRALVFGI